MKHTRLFNVKFSQMRAQLESLGLQVNSHSIRAFRREDELFEPYWHFHPEVELTLIQSGTGLRFVGDHIATYGEGDLVLLGKNLPHQWVSRPSEHTSLQRAIVIQFPEKLFSSFPECEGINRLLLQANTGLQFTQPSANLLGSIADLPQRRGPLQLSLLLDILDELNHDKNRRRLSKATRFQRAADQIRQQKRINACTSYIIQNLAEHLSVSHMAARSQMQPQSFCRWFKQQTGQTFIHFLNHARIHSACVLLLSTDLPVQQVAYQVGFGHISHFNRTFKTSLGVSPTMFRAANTGLTVKTK